MKAGKSEGRSEGRQAANGSNTDEDRAALDAEYTALKTQLGDMTANTNFGGQNLLGASGVFATAGGVDFQTGSTSSEVTNVDLSTELGSLNSALGGFGSLTSAADAKAEMDALSDFINTVGESRAAFGAQINNLEHNINNLANMTENLEASKGRIMDTDFASESGNMSKNQMLMQSGAQMLSATKTIPQLAMSMLG